MKKFIKIFLCILVIIILISIIFFSIDYIRVKNNKQPILCIEKGMIQDGGTKVYIGLGYKIIAFNRLNGYNETKFGTWAMKYTDFEKEYNYLNSTQDLPEILPIEEMIKKGYFVITCDNKIYNKDILDKFIKNTEINATNRIEDSIRIINYNIDGYPTVYDLEYTIGGPYSGYILTIDATRNNITPNNITTNYNLPGQYYSISLTEYPDFDAVSISLLLNDISNYSLYDNIEITRYILSSEIINMDNTKTK